MAKKREPKESDSGTFVPYPDQPHPGFGFDIDIDHGLGLTVVTDWSGNPVDLNRNNRAKIDFELFD